MGKLSPRSSLAESAPQNRIAGGKVATHLAFAAHVEIIHPQVRQRRLATCIPRIANRRLARIIAPQQWPTDCFRLMYLLRGCCRVVE